MNIYFGIAPRVVVVVVGGGGLSFQNIVSLFPLKSFSSDDLFLIYFLGGKQS